MKQASVRREEVQLACPCLKSFWEQLLTDLDGHRLDKNFGKDLIDYAHQNGRVVPIDKMVWLRRAEEFRLLPEPCDIALWYSADAPGPMQSNTSNTITQPYTTCRPKVYTRLENTSIAWTKQNGITTISNDLSMAASSSGGPPNLVYQDSMVIRWRTLKTRPARDPLA